MNRKKKTQNGKQLHNLEETIKQREKYQELEKAYQSALLSLNDAIGGEQIEKRLKNEAYAFLLAEGLLDKFLEFREHYHRTKAQEALYTLVDEADLGGLWIDL
ncbi:MAG: hypothetical protein IIY58_02990 [Aeriscardovia sp.]|nr:hypothetical protein [Aeriscardovia sp.]